MNRRANASLTNRFQAVNALWAPGDDLPEDRPLFPGPLGKRDTELRKAVRNHEVDYIKALLEAGVDPHKKDSSGMTAIDIAETEDLKFLLTDYMSLRHAARAKAARRPRTDPKGKGDTDGMAPFHPDIR